MKQTVSIHRIAKWGRRQEAFTGWRIKDQEETNTKYLIGWRHIVTLFGLCCFNLGSYTSYLKFQHPALWIQPPPFAAIIALHPVQISFDSSVAFSGKATSTIFTRASVSFDLHNMRKAKSWVFVTTDCLSFLQLHRKCCFHTEKYRRAFWTADTLYSSSTLSVLLKGICSLGNFFPVFSLAILIFHRLFKGCIPWCFNSHF